MSRKSRSGQGDLSKQPRNPAQHQSSVARSASSQNSGSASAARQSVHEDTLDLTDSVRSWPKRLVPVSTGPGQLVWYLPFKLPAHPRWTVDEIQLYTLLYSGWFNDWYEGRPFPSDLTREEIQEDGTSLSGLIVPYSKKWPQEVQDFFCSVYRVFFERWHRGEPFPDELKRDDMQGLVAAAQKQFAASPGAVYADEHGATSGAGAVSSSSLGRQRADQFPAVARRQRPAQPSSFQYMTAYPVDPSASGATSAKPLYHPVGDSNARVTGQTNSSGDTHTVQLQQLLTQSRMRRAAVQAARTAGIKAKAVGPTVDDEVDTDDDLPATKRPNCQ